MVSRVSVACHLWVLHVMSHGHCDMAHLVSICHSTLTRKNESTSCYLWVRHVTSKIDESCQSDFGMGLDSQVARSRVLRIRVNAPVHTNTHAHANTNAHTRTYTRIHTHTRTHICTRTHAHTHTHTRTHTRTHTYTHITHWHTHPHTQMQTHCPWTKMKESRLSSVFIVSYIKINI